MYTSKGIASYGAKALCLVSATFVTSGCFTSPHWDYEPSSTTAQIPFQIWTTSASTSVLIECARETTAHGSPRNGDASYRTVTTLWPDSHQHYDSFGSVMYSASTKVALPSECWDYFGSYGFWQANIRISQVVSGQRRMFTSFDANGLECLGRENGKAQSWTGYLNQGCEKTYLGSTTKIPYLVLRFDGGPDGIADGASAASPTIQGEVMKAKTPSIRADVKPTNIEDITPILSPNDTQVRRLQSGAALPR